MMAIRQLVLLVTLLCSSTSVHALCTNHLQRLCRAASLSYLPHEDAILASADARRANLVPLAQVVEPATESGATIFQNRDSQDKELLVAFRGSATPRNFATNFRFQLEPLQPFQPEARAHEGFQEAAAGLWELLEPELQRLRPKNDEMKLTFTGHSLGGGTAQLCALHAAAASADTGVSVGELVTFGGPITGDGVFARYVEEEAMPGVPISHIVHDKDPILVGNGPLWEKLGFERAGDTVQCEPHRPRLLVEDSVGVGGSAAAPFAWNILDHCKYLGVYVGPRLR